MLFPAFSRSYLRFMHIANYLLRTLSQQTNALDYLCILKPANVSPFRVIIVRKFVVIKLSELP